MFTIHLATDSNTNRVQALEKKTNKIWNRLRNFSDSFYSLNLMDFCFC